MPLATIDVDRTTYQALQLAQAAINGARASLLYGSGNQIVDLLQMRGPSGPFDGSTLPRLTTLRNSAAALLAAPHAELSGLGIDDRTYRRGIWAGLALYYRAGNCGEHAELTFSFLTQFGFPGLEIALCSLPSPGDHAFTLINWEGCQNPVVSDAWPVRGQACRWSEFFANGAIDVISRHTITDQNMGFDIIGQAFRAVNPALVQQLPAQSRVGGYSQQDILRWISGRPRGLYNHRYTVTNADDTNQFQEYRYVDPQNNNYVNLLSQGAPIGERWTASLAPIIEDTGGRFAQAQMIDPNARYAGQRVA